MEKSIANNNLYSCLDSHPIFKISVSGGPCGGKTTFLHRAKPHFQAKGYKVITIPQVPTLLSTAGVDINTSVMTLKDKLTIQTSIMRLKMAIEDEIARVVAIGNQPTIIFSDRGTMDSCAYMTKDEFSTVLNQEGWNAISIRDKRYNAVVFLVSAADGAQSFYSFDNNEARHQNIDFSRMLDQKTLESWIGHPNLIVIENEEGGIERKMKTAINFVEQVIGLRESTNDNKHLVQSIDIPQDCDRQTFEVEETTLVNVDPTTCVSEKVCKRGFRGSYSYQRQIELKGQKEGQVNILKVMLDPMEYLTLISTRTDRQYPPVKYKTVQFVSSKKLFMVDQIHSQDRIRVLRCDKQGSLQIPSFIKTGEDVTNNTSYSIQAMFQKPHPGVLIQSDGNNIKGGSTGGN